MGIAVVSSRTIRGDDSGTFSVSDGDPASISVQVGREIVLSNGEVHRNGVAFFVEGTSSRLTDEQVEKATHLLDEWQSKLVERLNKE